MKENNSPSYSVIDHYLGDKGRAYFERLNQEGIIKALYNKHIWDSHISVDDDILDFGCSGGFLLHVLNGKKKIGVDINPYARDYASKNGIVVYETLDQVPGKFDKVISSHTLEHIPYPRQALLELKEKLRDENSRMLLLLPLEDWRAKTNKVFKENDMNMHIYAWTPQILGNLMSSCGLKVEEIRIVTHAWSNKMDFLWQLSPRVFHLAAYGWSIICKHRQLFAVAGSY